MRAPSLPPLPAGQPRALTHCVALLQALEQLLQRHAQDGRLALRALWDVQLPPKQALLQVVGELLLLQASQPSAVASRAGGRGESLHMSQAAWRT